MRQGLAIGLGAAGCGFHRCIMLTRRLFLKYTGGATMSLCGIDRVTGMAKTLVPSLQGGGLDPYTIPKFKAGLLVPPVMPRAGTIPLADGLTADYYEIAMRQFRQQILPVGYPRTPVWGYGPVTASDPNALLIFNAPSLTIEALWNRPVRVKWINDLKDSNGRFRRHLLPVDPTLHWANPPGGVTMRDTRPAFRATPTRYTGPIPIVTHVHGAVGVGDESDGYPEAWFLPDAINIAPTYAREGTWYDFFKAKASAKGITGWDPGASVGQYPNTQRATTLWYHDHALGLTRLNVYAGPAGFFLLRGGPAGDEAVIDSKDGSQAVLPGPAPKAGDAFPPDKPYYEIPLAIQDRAFNADGTLFYPDTRELFDGITGPFLPEEMGFSPIWNPEYFGNSIIVNGNTWPYLEVERRRYRFRVLNGCQSRFLILDFSGIPGVSVWQIGNEGGFLPAPVNITANHGNRLLIALAERADLIVDFTSVPFGKYVLKNVAPDEPFGGGEPGVDFPVADPNTTGQIMQFRIKARTSQDLSTPPQRLRLPAVQSLPAAVRSRRIALLEMMGMGYDATGEEVEGPLEAMLGRVDRAGFPHHDMWMDPVTENPGVGDTETWEIFNLTGDAHPIHLHEVMFKVISRQGLQMVDDEPAVPLVPIGTAVGPEPWERGFKDTVIAYPGQVTRVRATFENAGQFVWHCHILEHEDNEMMRPLRIGPPQDGQPRA